MARTRSLGRRFSSRDPPAALQAERKRSIKSKTKKDRALTVMSTSKPDLPVPPVRLQKPMRSFSIPIVRAELVMDESLTNLGTQITYCAPEEVVAFDFGTRRKHTTCRVPVMEGGRLRGYVPLPMRYRDIWLELSYNIVLLMNIWELWSKEEGKPLRPKEKKMATACRQNVGTLLVQYMLARLLAVEELVGLSYNIEPGEECVKSLNEWKVRMLRDWFDMTHSEAKADGSEFMRADPASIENKAFFERRWEIEDDGSDILSPPADPNLWIHGRIEGLDDIFEKTIKPQAFQEISKPSQFFKTRYEKGANLPARWHEGHEPRPFFWSIKQCDWFCKGNDYWNSPIDLLHYVLSTDPVYHDLEQFLGNLRSLAGIITVNPEWEDIQEAAKDLWLGKIIWREFVSSLRRGLNLSKEQTVTSEKRDDQNPFNTLEARLVFEGYMREGTKQKAQSDRDVILWKGLNQMGPQEYRPVWKWVASEIQLHDHTVMEVLEKAGTWWQGFRDQQAKETNVTEKPDREESDACSDATPEIELQVNDQQQGGSGSFLQDTEKGEEDVSSNLWLPKNDGAAQQNSEDLGDAFPRVDNVGGHLPGAIIAVNSTFSTHPPLPSHASIIDGVPEHIALHNYMKSNPVPDYPFALSANTSTTPQVLNEKGSQRPELKGLHHIYLGFTRYLEGHESLEVYRESLITSFCSDFEASILKFVEDLQHFPADQLTMEVAKPILDSFVRRVQAIQAKKEAGESQNALL